MEIQGQNRQKSSAPLPDVQTLAPRSDIFVMPIIGQIEGHYVLPENQKATKYEQIIPRLVDLEQDESVRGVLFILHTLGGDVEAGLAMAEMIASMRTPTVSLVLGGGHSIGVPLAVSAKRSFIVPSATMTIHPVRINGLVLGAEQAFTYFRRMQKRITSFVTGHSGMTEERFSELCMATDELATDIGTVLNGTEAVKEGLIGGLGSLSDAIEALYDMIES